LTMDMVIRYQIRCLAIPQNGFSLARANANREGRRNSLTPRRSSLGSRLVDLAFGGSLRDSVRSYEGGDMSAANALVHRARRSWRSRSTWRAGAATGLRPAPAWRTPRQR
jgi:hypothetical protein